jgi:hypothetical protein
MGGPFYTNIGDRTRALRHDDVPGAIGVFDSAASAAGGGCPIGMALCTGWDADGRAVFRLLVGKVEMPGRWL